MHVVAQYFLLAIVTESEAVSRQFSVGVQHVTLSTYIRQSPTNVGHRIGFDTLAAAGRRNDAVHAKVFDELPVVVEGMADSNHGHGEARGRRISPRNLDGLEHVGFI